MGKIVSDFYQTVCPAEEMEVSFSAGELLRMASMDVQEEYAGWIEDDGDYIPGDMLLALLRDPAFFAELMSMRDAGEPVILSGVTMAFTPDHVGNMGLEDEDVSENVIRFMESEDTMADCIRAAMSGRRGHVSALYVFANGWVGIETECLADTSWQEAAGMAPADTPAGPEEVYEPAESYLFSDEGDLVATPDLHYDIDAWMDFVDLFSVVHEEAAAAEDVRGVQETEDAEDSGQSFIVFSDEVQEAMQAGKPVVVIESVATFGGMIYPGISEFAFRMRNSIRENGATPAFTAIIRGQIHVCLSDDEILYLEKNRGTMLRASIRDIPILLAKKADGVLTIAAAMQVAAMVGLTVVCGSGIGGAQAGSDHMMDISPDLESVAANTVMVIASGTKPILDLGLTMEYLETKGVPVIGYRTDLMPEYMVRGSGYRLTYRMDKPEELAQVMKIKAKMGIPGGVLVVNPIPKEFELNPTRTKEAYEAAAADVRANNVRGKAITPYMMGRIKAYLGQESVSAQKEFMISTAILAAKTAAAIRR